MHSSPPASKRTESLQPTIRTVARSSEDDSGISETCPLPRPRDIASLWQGPIRCTLQVLFYRIRTSQMYGDWVELGVLVCPGVFTARSRRADMRLAASPCLLRGMQILDASDEIIP